MGGKEKIQTWLKNHTFCVIATSVQNMPWAATVNYVSDENMNLLIRTDPRSLKFQNILKNPNVCVVIDSQDRTGTLQIKGVAELIEPKSKENPNLIIKSNLFVLKRKSENSEEIEEIVIKM